MCVCPPCVVAAVRSGWCSVYGRVAGVVDSADVFSPGAVVAMLV